MQPQLHTPGGCIYSDNFLKLVHPPCLPYPSFHTVSIVAALLTPCVPSRKVKQINLSSNLYAQNSRLCQYRQCLLDEISSPGYPLISFLLNQSSVRTFFTGKRMPEGGILCLPMRGRVIRKGTHSNDSGEHLPRIWSRFDSCASPDGSHHNNVPCQDPIPPAAEMPGDAPG